MSKENGQILENDNEVNSDAKVEINDSRRTLDFNCKKTSYYQQFIVK